MGVVNFEEECEFREEMKQLTTYQLRKAPKRHFLELEKTQGIDLFCSSLDWTLPAHTAFIPDHPLYLLEGEGGYVNLARGFDPKVGRYLQALEASWCLASPFVGRDLPLLMDEFDGHLHGSDFVDWDFLYLSGIPVEGELARHLVLRFGDKYRIGVGEDTTRFIADISGGIDIWLGQRSSKFRANIRRILRKSKNVNIEAVYIQGKEVEVESLYQRILNVEGKSWKGKAGTGILDGAMRVFYEKMLPRLARRGALRIVFLRKDEEDIAYVFGGLLGNTYRGLQMSYDNQFREYGLGNLIQYKMIENLCEEGIEVYDLGSEVEYKSSWASDRLITTTFWILK